MPINVAVEEPGSGIVRSETDSDVICNCSDIHDIAANGVIVIVLVTTCNSDDVEVVSVKMHRMLSGNHRKREVKL